MSKTSLVYESNLHLPADEVGRRRSGDVAVKTPTVKELEALLLDRGLDTKGLKADLEMRLQAAAGEHAAAGASGVAQ